METQINGNFGLFEIDKIFRRNNFYEISFRNSKKRFAGIHLHCFLTDEDIPKKLINLKSGDKIWIDVSAYTADKSLFTYNHFGTKGRYVRAMKFNENE
ncbi:MAG: hypothetical protein PF487_04375 [Bacteroidales bacterium]|jgi:hypothetical protein|nr:hypothetical protein [Bacteroidales bacterium]